MWHWAASLPQPGVQFGIVTALANALQEPDHRIGGAAYIALSGGVPIVRHRQVGIERKCTAEGGVGALERLLGMLAELVDEVKCAAEPGPSRRVLRIVRQTLPV